MLPCDQVTGGRNGYGAKLANIFSIEFVVETADGTRGRKYRQARIAARSNQPGCHMQLKTLSHTLFVYKQRRQRPLTTPTPQCRKACMPARPEKFCTLHFTFCDRLRAQ